MTIADIKSGYRYNVTGQKIMIALVLNQFDQEDTKSLFYAWISVNS